MSISASHSWTRRRVLYSSLAAAAGPLILPKFARGAAAPSEQMLFGVIGTGRQGRSDMSELMKSGLKNGARVVAVCDLDASRAALAKKQVDDFHAKAAGDSGGGCAVYSDPRKLLAHSGLDGVLIATPDHWHAQNAIAAAESGKHIYLEKPLTYTHAEGRRLVKAVAANKVTFQTGSMQRSHPHWRFACELVRNGRLGKLHTITVQLPPDSGTGRKETMPVPAGFDYNQWVGPRPFAPYTEDRVHPQQGFSRPGWLQVEDFCLGMITGWGAHMFDIARWGHGSDDTGLVEIEAKGEFPDRGLFNVHTNFTAEGRFADGVRLLAKTGPAGVRFEGSSGSLFVSREKLETEPASLAKETIGEREKHLYVSDHHYDNFLQCIRSGKETICPVTVGHHSNTVCLITHIAMKLGRKLKWDPAAECFPDDDAANTLLDYTPRKWET